MKLVEEKCFVTVSSMELYAFVFFIFFSGQICGDYIHRQRKSIKLRGIYGACGDPTMTIFEDNNILFPQMWLMQFTLSKVFVISLPFSPLNFSMQVSWNKLTEMYNWILIHHETYIILFDGITGLHILGHLYIIYTED